jgi:hypothetical protein
MKKVFKKLEDIYAAATFAEAGEAETAREIIRDRKTAEKQLRERPDKRQRPGVSAN